MGCMLRRYWTYGLLPRRLNGMNQNRSSAMLDIRSTVNFVRSAVADYRSDVRAQRRLVNELAEYRSPSERQDLYSSLSRHTAEEIAPIERILNLQAAAGGRSR